MKYKTNLTQIGSFEISGKMRVSDPCYKPDVWCCGTLNTRPGIWDAAVLVMDDKMTDGWGDRVAVIAAKHENCAIPLDAKTINNSTDGSKVIAPWKMADFEVGVDSGQAGFYDDNNFVERNGGEDDDWYDELRALIPQKSITLLFTTEKLMLEITHWLSRTMAMAAPILESYRSLALTLRLSLPVQHRPQKSFAR